MPIWISTVDIPLGVLFRRLVGNLMIVVSFVATVIGLTQLDALTPRPSPEPEFSDPPGSGLIVRSEVIHLWLPETLVYPGRHELPALIARTHQELKQALELRGQENLWYAITVRGHQANQGTADISFIRYPYREPENFQELLKILATVAESPTRHPSADYSAGIVHIMPARISQREWLEAMQGSSFLREAFAHGVERKP